MKKTNITQKGTFSVGDTTPVYSDMFAGTSNAAGQHSPPKVDRIYGTWGSYYNIAEAIFHLLKGDSILLAKKFGALRQGLGT